jgi:hypothetical protein
MIDPDVKRKLDDLEQGRTTAAPQSRVAHIFAVVIAGHAGAVASDARLRRQRPRSVRAPAESPGGPEVML